MNESSLLDDFRTGLGFWLDGGEPQALFDFLAEDALVILDDTPFILDRENLTDHVGFHAGGIWERQYLTLRDVDVQVIGGAGMVSANYQYRGKPRDAGYRQQDGMLTAQCAWHGEAGRWRCLKLHANAILSAIHHSSPG